MPTVVGGKAGEIKTAQVEEAMGWAASLNLGGVPWANRDVFSIEQIESIALWL